MANYQPTPIQLPGTAAQPSGNVAAASDTYDVVIGASYILMLRNTTGTPNTVKLDDPNTVGVVGATTAQDPDVSIVVPATTGFKMFFLSTWRFRDNTTGKITFTNSAPGAGVSHDLFGPL